MRPIRTCLIVAFFTTLSTLVFSAEWRVGVAKVDITPAKPLWMAGYAGRTKPAEGMLHPLWAKALAIADEGGGQIVMVTTDLIGDEFGRELADTIRTRVAQNGNIAPDQILFNFSHTHCGPVMRVHDGALVTYGLNAQQQADVSAYCQTLSDQLVAVIQNAYAAMQPAQLAFGQSVVTFAANRRQQFKPNGPVDHTVPVLRVRGADNRLLAVLFGYACHNTTLGGDVTKYNGDYAGFAQIALEKSHPGAVALFMTGCGGDANPSPRGKIELAEQHGFSLASAAEKVLTADLPALHGPLVVQFDRVDLPFVDPPSRVELEQRRGQGNVYEQRLTDRLLARIAQGQSLPASYPCPVHVLHFGDGLSLIALSGETVVDYSLRLRREFADRPLWVAGYCNEVFAYVPSERVLAEGGYEGGEAMKYFGIHGPFKPGLENRIIGLVKTLMERGPSSN